MRRWGGHCMQMMVCARVLCAFCVHLLCRSLSDYRADPPTMRLAHSKFKSKQFSPPACVCLRRRNWSPSLENRPVTGRRHCHRRRAKMHVPRSTLISADRRAKHAHEIADLHAQVILGTAGEQAEGGIFAAKNPPNRTRSARIAPS